MKRLVNLRQTLRARRVPIDYLVFITGGGIGMVLNLSVTYLLTELVGFWYLASFAFGIAANWLWNFIFHRRVTFGDRPARRLAASARRFVAVNLSLTAFGLSSVYLLTDVVGLPYMWAVGVVVVSFSIINFLISRSVIF